MNTMQYKDYTARIEFDDIDHIFTGRLLGIEDIVTFHGASVAELETAFHEAVDHYLEVCANTGRAAQKPYSGRFAVRMPPELHARAAVKAAAAGKSINQWVIEVVQTAVRQ